VSSSTTVEICVESVEDAIAAERGGADRIEFCSDLASEGITPSTELMKTVRDSVHVPIFVIIRPRAGNFCYSNAEFESMQESIREAKLLGMDGVVLGILDREQCIDIERTKLLVELARPLSTTFHHAFDISRNLQESVEGSLDALVKTGVDRVLTSGGKASAVDGSKELAQLVKAAGQRIIIMPGGGINSGNVARIIREAEAPEIHTSLRTWPRKGQTSNQQTDARTKVAAEFLPTASLEQRVRELKHMIARDL
jgi:copper homeostasis protein